MKARITAYDDNGKPLSVETEDGFMLSHGPYDPEKHGWIEGQLDSSDFPIIQAGREMAGLVGEVNSLRRENWQLRQQLKAWITAAGFGRE